MVGRKTSINFTAYAARAEHEIGSEKVLFEACVIHSCCAVDRLLQDALRQRPITLELSKRSLLLTDGCIFLFVISRTANLFHHGNEFRVKI